MEVAFFWVMFCIIVAVLANSRGRSWFWWGLLATVISPLIAGLLVLALDRPKDKKREVDG